MLSLGKISKKDTSFKRGTLKGFGSLSQKGVWNYLNFPQRCRNENQTCLQKQNKTKMKHEITFSFVVSIASCNVSI